MKYSLIILFVLLIGCTSTNKTLETHIFPIYIDSTMSSKEHTKETTKKVLKSIFTNIYI